MVTLWSPFLLRNLDRLMSAFLNHQGQAENALGASFDPIHSSGDGKATANNVTRTDNPQLSRDKFHRLKGKLVRLG